MMSVPQPESNRVGAMIAALLVKAKVAAIVRKAIVGHAKGHRAATGRTSPARIKAIDRVAIGHINHARIKVTAKGHRVVTDRTNHARIKAIDRIAPKLIVNFHGHRAISSLGHHVAKASDRWHRPVPTAPVMTNTRCHRHRRQVVRRTIKTPCGAGAGG